MPRLSSRIALLATLLLACNRIVLFAQDADYSKEPFVVESLKTSAVFSADGTGVEERFARIRIQSDAALKEYKDVLRTDPNRFRSILGKARAAKQAGDTAIAYEAYQKLVALSKPAGPERPAILDRVHRVHVVLTVGRGRDARLLGGALDGAAVSAQL